MSDFDLEKKDKAIEGVIENPVETKTTKVEVILSLDEADKEYSEFESRSEELFALILSDDIPEGEKDVFRQELKAIKEAGKTLKQKSIDRLCAVILIVPNTVVKFSEAYSMKFGDKSKRIKGMEFVFDNLEIENKEKYRREWDERKKDPDCLSGIDVPEFPLNTEGIEILHYCNKGNVHSIYGIEDLIKSANFIYRLIKKGVSLETLKHIKLSNYIEIEEIANNDGLIQKIKLLQKTGIFACQGMLDEYDIKNISIDQINLLIKNPYMSFDWEHSYGIYQLTKYLNEENLKKLKDFDDTIDTVKVQAFYGFCDVLADKPQEMIDVYKAQYDKDGDKALWKISQNRNRMDLDGLDKEKLALVKRLIQESSFSIYQDSVEPWTRLNENIFDRCKVLGIKDINAEFYWNMNYISGMSEGEFEMLVELQKYYESPLGNQIAAIKGIDNIFEKDELKGLIDILNKIDISGGVNGLNNYFKDKKTLLTIKHFLEMASQVKDIDVIDFTLKVYGVDGLRSMCLYETSAQRLAGLMHGMQRDQSSLPVNIAKDADCRENIFLNFTEIQKMLRVIGVDFSDEDIDLVIHNVLRFSAPILVSDYDNFPFQLSDELKEDIVENLVSNYSTFTIEKFKNFDDRYLSHLDVKKRQDIVNDLFESILHRFPFFIVDHFKIFEQEYLSHTEDRQEVLDNLFRELISRDPFALMKSVDFPFTLEQQKYIDVFKRVAESPSREMKNMSAEIVPLISGYESFEEANDAVTKIEQIFLTNNIPMVGKQYKVFEVLYPDKKLNTSIQNKSKVESLKTLKDSSKQRLTIFKDLMRAHIASCDSNLEQYLLVLQSGRDILDRFEQGDNLDKQEKDRLKLFLKKINVLSGHTGRKTMSITDDVSDEAMYKELSDLKDAFGVEEGGSIIQRFERTFLKRIGIESIDDAISLMRQYKQEANDRNVEASQEGVLTVKGGDLVKGMSSDYLDTYLDKGVYAPEFIGAASIGAKNKSQNSDSTPFDTDMTIVEEDNGLSDALAGYGDMSIILKKKPQFEKDKLDIFKTGVIGQNHYGIRTGFGSTEIDAICIRQQGISPRGMDKIRFFVAQKGFYIPIYDFEGKITFTKEEYDKYRKVFDGVGRFEGSDIGISEEWKDGKSIQEIKNIAQTEEKMKGIEDVRDIIQDKIKDVLKEVGISLHKGEYDDSLVGAIITDTGSTGRGSALDEKFDFDFAVKLDDNDWDKVSGMMKKLKDVFEMEASYENKGMTMFRSKEVEIGGYKMTIDVGFNKKSDSEEFDAHTALGEKYRSIEKTHGRQALLDTLTNVRFAKKKLKEAGCYKKGLGDNGQQGGLGGIGVEYWIVQNGGDCIRAFKDFLKVAVVNDTVIPFDEFKKVYKVFSAGVNIRGNQKVENFVENMTEDGYKKMVDLAKDLTQ